MPALYAVKISVEEIIFMFNECNKTLLGEMSFFIRLAGVSDETDLLTWQTGSEHECKQVS